MKPGKVPGTIRVGLVVTGAASVDMVAKVVNAEAAGHLLLGNGGMSPLNEATPRPSGDLGVAC